MARVPPGESVTKYPRIWVLLGQRRGDNNQLLALAEGLGLPFETRSLRYRRRWALSLRLFPKRPYLLKKASQQALRPPWPDVVIGIGRRSVAVARWIRMQNGGRTKLVRLGNPRAEPDLFDLVITTPQYPVDQTGNVLVLPVSMGRYAKPPKTKAEETAWLDALPRPHLLVSVGGSTRYWTLSDDTLLNSLKTLKSKARKTGGTLIAVTSPRTPENALNIINHTETVLGDGYVRFPVLLASADEHYVTADSVSMISEAVLTGKPVGLIPVELDEEGERELGTEGYSGTSRDLRRFWNLLHLQGAVGTIDEPRSATVANPVQIAAKAVRDLLGDFVK